MEAVSQRYECLWILHKESGARMHFTWGRKRNPKIFQQSCTGAWAQPMKDGAHGTTAGMHRFLPASTSRAAININSNARAGRPITRCTHNCRAAHKSCPLYTWLLVSPSQRLKIKRSEKWSCLFLCRAGQGGTRVERPRRGLSYDRFRCFVGIKGFCDETCPSGESN